MKFPASILALALLAIAGFADPVAAQAPAGDVPAVDLPAAGAPAPQIPQPATDPGEADPPAAGELLGLDNPLAVPDAQDLSCQYTCPNGSPFLCPAYPDRPFPSCVGGCCVYI